MEIENEKEAWTIFQKTMATLKKKRREILSHVHKKMDAARIKKIKDNLESHDPGTKNN